MIEVREVLRAWLGGVGLRTVAAQAGVDRKTIRYAACGITNLMPTRWLCRARRGKVGPAAVRLGFARHNRAGAHRLLRNSIRLSGGW